MTRALSSRLGSRSRASCPKMPEVVASRTFSSAAETVQISGSGRDIGSLLVRWSLVLLGSNRWPACRFHHASRISRLLYKTRV